MSEALLIEETVEPRFRRLEDRLTILERTERLTNSSLQDGAITVVDASRNPLVRLGLLPNDDRRIGDGLGPSGAYGIMFYTVNGRVAGRIDNGGWWNPRNYLIPSSNIYIHSHTLSSYSEGFRWDFYSTGTKVYCDMSAWASAGTCDFKIKITEYGGSYVDLLEVINANGQYGGLFTIPTGCLTPGTGTDQIGRFMSLRMDTKLTSGAGPANLRINASTFNAHA